MLSRVKLALNLSESFNEILTLIFWLLRKFSCKVFNKLQIKYLHYPRPIKKSYKNLKQINLNYSTNFSFHPMSIDVDTGIIKFNGTPEKFFGLKFTDIEYVCSIHRWNWLIDDNWSEEAIHMKINCMNYWLNNFWFKKKNITWFPYEVTERICNFINFSQQVSRKSDFDFEKYKNVILKKGYWLAQNLEYKEEVATGNHVFNNGRAILHAGIFCNDKNLIKLAFEIFKERLPHLVGKGFFFLEGSSHYHLLFHRWLLEILKYARNENLRDIDELITPYLNKIEIGSDFFVNIEHKELVLPLFGDISPDIEPLKIAGVRYCRLKGNKLIYNGPKKLIMKGSWPDLFCDIKKIWKEQKNCLPNKKINNCEWQCWRHFNWTLFSHNPHQFLEKSGHFHEDYTSFTLYLYGLPVIVDIGRGSYCDGVYEAIQQKSIKSHNSITLNGLSPAFFLPNRQDIPPYLKKFNSNINEEIDKSKLSIKVQNNGFSRFFKKSVTHIRNFEISKNRFVVKDKIIGIGNYNFDWNINFGMAKSELNGLLDITPTTSLSFKFFHDNEKKSLQFGYSNTLTNKYGSFQKNLFATYKTTCRLPFETKFELEVKN